MITTDINVTVTWLPTSRHEEAKASWTLHVRDGFDTQIGTRVDVRGNGSWRLQLKDHDVFCDTEVEMRTIITGILIGRGLC